MDREKLEQADFKKHLTKEIEERVVYVENHTNGTEFFDKHDNRIYYESYAEYGAKTKYDKEGNRIYGECSNGATGGEKAAIVEIDLTEDILEKQVELLVVKVRAGLEDYENRLVKKIKLVSNPMYLVTAHRIAGLAPREIEPNAELLDGSFISFITLADLKEGIAEKIERINENKKEYDGLINIIGESNLKQKEV